MYQRIKQALLLILQLFAINSCTEKYELELEYQQPRIVVEGLISNIEGEKYNFIRLSRSATTDTFTLYNGVHARQYIRDTLYGIKNALVILNDNNGTCDTLEQPPPVDQNSFFDVDSNLIIYEEDNYRYKAGYYYPTKIKGEPGHTYYLEIQHEGNTYHANCYMPPVPKIDSMTFEFKKMEPAKLSGFAPIVYFNEPVDEKNYYLFDFAHETWVWGISILDDKYMGDHISGLDIFKGQTVDWWIDAYPNPGRVFTIEMHSLTTEGYAFYNSLIEVFNNDGSTYHPAPATAPGNISNGALGFFRASAIETVTAKVPEEVPDGIFE